MIGWRHVVDTFDFYFISCHLQRKFRLRQKCVYPVNIWRNDNVIIASKRRCVLTIWWRYYYAVCPLGTVPVASFTLTHWGRDNWSPSCRRHFQVIFLTKNVWISVQFSLKFGPKCPINNIPALVQIMAWRQTGDKPLSKPSMHTYLRHPASMS